MSFLNDNKILYEFQFGFRQNHSTELALAEITDQIYKSLDNSNFIFALYLDLSKAFDTVDFQILLSKLKHYGIKGLELKWFESYLYGRSQQVAIDDQLSDILEPTCGVPQGSILGPLLFLIYLNDLPYSSNILNFRLFADDTKIFFSSPNLTDIQDNINAELPYVTNWLYTNKLSLNVDKTKFVLFKSPTKREAIDLHVVLANSIIKRENSKKHLGIVFDSDMSWKTQCMNVTLKISKAIGILFKMKNYINVTILRSIYFAIVHSHLNYGLLSWGAAINQYIAPIQVKQNLFLRVMYKLPPLYNTNRLYHNNKLLRINELYHSKLLRLIHSSFNNLLPPAFNNFLTLAREIHRIKTRYVANGNFFVEQINNNYGHKSPSFQCNLLWVHIPRHCKSFEKLRFKKYVFNYLLARYHQ